MVTALLEYLAWLVALGALVVLMSGFGYGLGYDAGWADRDANRPRRIPYRQRSNDPHRR